MKIYFSGSMYGGRQKIELYKMMIRKLEKKGVVLTKQVADDRAIIEEEKQSDEEIFNNLEEKLKQCDVLIADVTVPSLGVGYELGYADKLGKKIICLYDLRDTSKVTTMIRGNKRIKLISYDGVDSCLEIINGLNL